VGLVQLHHVEIKMAACKLISTFDLRRITANNVCIDRQWEPFDLRSVEKKPDGAVLEGAKKIWASIFQSPAISPYLVIELPTPNSPSRAHRFYDHRSAMCVA
jgi:hypothetical protein